MTLSILYIMIRAEIMAMLGAIEREDGFYWVKLDGMSKWCIAKLRKDKSSVLYKYCWHVYQPHSVDGSHYYYLHYGQELGEIGPRILPSV